MKSNTSFAESSKSQTSFDEINETITQVADYILILPIPGLSDVLEPITDILKAFQPDPLDAIQSALNDANAKLDNMYNVVFSAIQKDDIQDCLALSVSGYDNLEKKLNEILARQGRDTSSEVDSIFTNDIKTPFSLNLTSNVNDYMHGYAATQQDKESIPLAEYLGGYNYGLQKLSEHYMLLAEAGRKLSYFYNDHQEQCDPNTWKPFLEKVGTVLKDQKTAYENFIDVTVKSYYPECIHPIMTGRHYALKLKGSDRLLYSATKTDTKSIDKVGTGTGKIYRLLEANSYTSSRIPLEYGFNLKINSSPDDKETATFLFSTGFSFDMGVTRDWCDLGHNYHLYVVSQKSGELAPDSQDWRVIFFPKEGALQFKVPYFLSPERWFTMRENWGHLTIEDKESNSHWEIIPRN